MERAFDKIVSNLVRGRICHILISYGFAHGDFTVCTMVPVGVIEEGGQRKRVCFPHDYKWWLKILATHPRIKELSYDEEENTIKAIFLEPEEWAEPEEIDEDFYGDPELERWAEQEDYGEFYDE